MRILAATFSLLLVAGCTTPAGEPASTDGDGAAEAPRPLQPDTPPRDARAFVVELDGRLGLGACVPTGPHTCSIGSVGDA